MKIPIILVILLVFVGGCATVNDGPAQNETIIEGVHELVLSEQELQTLGMYSNEPECEVEVYETSPTSPLMEQSSCYYYIERDNAEVVITLQRFTNLHDTNGSYQYQSLHLRGFQGLISEDEYGDQSRFYVNNESDTYYYHLWITEDTYLIHITSKGSQEAGEDVEAIGQLIMSNFD